MWSANIEIIFRLSVFSFSISLSYKRRIILSNSAKYTGEDEKWTWHLSSSVFFALLAKTNLHQLAQYSILLKCTNQVGDCVENSIFETVMLGRFVLHFGKAIPGALIVG